MFREFIVLSALVLGVVGNILYDALVIGGGPAGRLSLHRSDARNFRRYGISSNGPQCHFVRLSRIQILSNSSGS